MKIEYTLRAVVQQVNIFKMNGRLHDMTPNRMLLDVNIPLPKKKKTLKIIDACTTAHVDKGNFND